MAHIALFSAISAGSIGAVLAVIAVGANASARRVQGLVPVKAKGRPR